jgi:hypothetical protein
MAPSESALLDAAPICNGQSFVADGVLRVSTIGLSLDRKTGVAKAVADLKTLWSAAVVKDFLE